MADSATEPGRDIRETERVTILPVDGEVADGANGGSPEPETIEVSPADVEEGPALDVHGARVLDEEEPPALEDEDEDDGLADMDTEDGVVVSYEDRIVEALPELARLAAIAWTRTAAWGAQAGLRTGARLARATVDPQAAAELAQGVGSNMRAYARELLGITDLEERLDALTPVGDRFAGPRRGELTRPATGEARVSPEVALRAQGAELLRQSADVSVDDRLHPAFGRILSELAPDEGRILRLLAQEGPQPVVDVRAANLIGVGSQLVAQNLNMVDMQAGCRHSDRVPAYLINLQRLGLASFSDEPLDDAITYQVLEAQPHVLAVIQAASRAKTVQRSLRLTPFGTEFCEACFASEPGPQPELLPDGAPASDGDQPDQPAADQ